MFQGEVVLDKPPDSTTWLFEDIEEGFLQADIATSSPSYPSKRIEKAIEEFDLPADNQDQIHESIFPWGLDSRIDVPLNQSTGALARTWSALSLCLFLFLLALPHLSNSRQVLPFFRQSIIILLMIILLTRLLMATINRGRVAHPVEQEFYAGLFVNSLLCMYFSWRTIDLGYFVTLFLGIGFQGWQKEENMYKHNSPFDIDFLSFKYLHPLCMMLQASCVLAFYL